MHKRLRIFFNSVIVLFALIGVFLVLGYVATLLKLTNTTGVIDVQSDSIRNNVDKEKIYTIFPLEHTPEWIAFRQAVAKDKQVIDRVSKETGISGRVLIATLVPEQMRFFYSNRAAFKRAFEPLKILGSQSQFSWGLFGIKDETAQAVELHLTDSSSPFYLGEKYAHLLDFSQIATSTNQQTGTSTTDSERYNRIIDEHNHYYSYLYTALYIAQIEKQWKSAGFPISDRPEILATLWNLGFVKSKPSADPKSGGAEIDINGVKYSFGSLAKDFYYSDELIELYP